MSGFKISSHKCEDSEFQVCFNEPECCSYSIKQIMVLQPWNSLHTCVVFILLFYTCTQCYVFDECVWILYVIIRNKKCYLIHVSLCTWCWMWMWINETKMFNFI